MTVSKEDKIQPYLNNNRLGFNHPKNYGEEKGVLRGGEERIEVKFEGIQGGTWVSITNRGSISLLGLEREEIVWIQEQLQKVVELKDFLGFIKKNKKKTKTHVLEICFNKNGNY